MSSEQPATEKIPLGTRGSNQQLWNLLQGNVVAAEDVIIEELKELLDRIVNGLTYYAPYIMKDGEKPIIFPSMRTCLTGGREAQNTETNASPSKSGDSKSDESSAAGGSGSTDESQQTSAKSSESLASFDELRTAIAQNLKIELCKATELLVSYMMFDYKGSNGMSYNKITDTYRSFRNFLEGLNRFYTRERISLLLCAQALLAEFGNESHRLYNTIEAIRPELSFKEWCLGLLNSIEVARNDEEIIEILHCLHLLMYKMPNETIPEFLEYFSNMEFLAVRKSEKMKMAESAAMYSALLVSGITDCCSATVPLEFSSVICKFIDNSFNTLLMNPYNIAPVFVAYDIFCKEDVNITTKMKSLSCNPEGTFSAISRLTENYGKDALIDRHQLSLTISASVFEALEVLLTNYDINHLGTNTEGFQILAKILQHSHVAENFLCGTPLALTALYTDATSIFPIDIYSCIDIWTSLCMSVRSKENCKTLIEGVIKLNCIAEFLDEDNSSYIRRVGECSVRNLRSRKIYDVQIDNGLNGALSYVDSMPYVSWELPPSVNRTALQVIRYIIEPMANQLNEMDDNRSLPQEAENFDYCPKLLYSLSELIIQYVRSTDDQILELTNLIYPLCTIMQKLIAYLRSVDEKVKLIHYQMGLVSAVNELNTDKIALFEHIYDFLPGDGTLSIVENHVLGYESVSGTNCEVTLAFLKLIKNFAENETCWQHNTGSAFETRFIRSIGFIAESILPSCANWRINRGGTRLKLYLKCFEIFLLIYSLDDSKWHHMKEESIRFLISANSCLIAHLKTDEITLLNATVRPTENNRLIVAAMTTCLKLLLKIIKFDRKVLLQLDDVVEGTLIKILGQLGRQRLNAKIPTLAMLLLKEVAENTTMSLLACFGNDEGAFRDVVIQRLELAAEDIHLKIAVLEFLTVMVQTQVGIIQYFFTDGVLESSVMDLMHENDYLSVACLRFFRALFRQGLALPRSNKQFWNNVLSPINSVKRGSELEIVTATMHILTFELFSNGVHDANFIAELDVLFEKETFSVIMDAVLSETNETAVKCILCVKQFVTLVLGRPELARLIPMSTLRTIQGQVLNALWIICQNQTEEEKYESLCTTLSELVTILTTACSATPTFTGDLVLKLIQSFNYQSVRIQLSLLSLINKCFSYCTDPLPSGTVENTLRILKKVLDGGMKTIQEVEEENSFPILIVTTVLLATIIEKQPVESWSASFQKDFIPMALLSICSVGVNRKKLPHVVANCLNALLSLADHPVGCKLLPTNGMTKSLWLHLHKFTDEVCEETWGNVFLLCLALNSKLLATQRHLYLDEALAFWGLYGAYLHHKLIFMMNLTELCVVVDDTDKGYANLKAVLCYNTFVLYDILMLTPFIEEWQSAQPAEVFKIINAVYCVLQEACSLLRQPLLLQSSVSFKSKTNSTEVKLSPKLLEMQTKLWDVCDICMHILVKLKSKDEEFIDKNDLITTMFQVGQLSIKALTKGERKFHSGINTTNRVSAILEKVMYIVYKYTMPVLDDAMVDAKFQMAFRRELGTEVISLCDGIRRLGIPKQDFLISICSKMESKFK